MSYFLYAWFAHFICILDQVTRENLGCHEAHGRFSLLCKKKLMRRVHWYNASTTISAGHHHTGALNNCGKMKICKSIRHLKRLDKKVRWRYTTWKV